MTPMLAALAGLDYAVLVAYLLGMVVVGLWFSRRERSAEDYFLAGRRIPWWAAGVSIFGTALSAVTFMGTPGRSYVGDWRLLLQDNAPLLLVPVVAIVYIPFYRRLRIRTAYEYLERRFNLPCRWLGSVTYILFQFCRMAVILTLTGIALQVATGWDLYACILVMGILAAAYTVAGGIEAVIWTDLAQVVVLLGGAIFAVVLICLRVRGGLGGIFASAAEAGKLTLVSGSGSWRGPGGAALWLILLGGAIGGFGTYTTDQGVVQRYLSTADARSARRALWTTALMGIPAGLLFYFFGTALWAYFGQTGRAPASGVQVNQVVPWFVVHHMPAGISGLVVAGIFAAAMSSLDSGINAIASAVHADFVARFRRLTDRGAVRLGRIVSLICAAVGIALASGLAGSDQAGREAMINIYYKMLFFFAGPLAGLFAAGIFTRRAGGGSALVGLCCGLAANIYVVLRTDVNWLAYAPIGLGVTFAVAWGLGWLSGGPTSAGRTGLRES